MSVPDEGDSRNESRALNLISTFLLCYRPYCGAVLRTTVVDYSKQRNLLKYYKQSEEFEDIKGVIRIRISKKNRQRIGQKKKYKRINIDLQNIHIINL